MRKPPAHITPCTLEVIVMPNGEVICAGKTIGWVEGPRGLGKYLTTIPPTNLAPEHQGVTLRGGKKR